MLKKKIGTIAVASVMAMTLAACGSDETTTAEVKYPDTMDALYEKAKQEGEVTIYGPTENLYAPVYAAFSARYPGIKITTSNIFGQELDTRLEGEKFAGGFKADMVHIGVSDLERFADMDYLQSNVPVGTEALPGEYRGRDNLWTVPSRHLYSVAYNTDKVKPEDAPKSWADLLDAKWNGKIAVSSPAISGATPQVFSSAVAAGAIDYATIEQFRDTKQKIYPSVANALQAVTTGENELALVAGYGTLMRQKKRGAPLAMSPLKDGAYMSDAGYALLKNSPHPHAARLLQSWTFSPEGQKAIVEHIYEFGTMPGTAAPEGAAEMGEFKGVPYPGGQKYREVLEQLGRIYK